MGKKTGFIDYKQKLNTYKSAKKRIQNFDEFLQAQNDEERKIQAMRCMDCGIPFCQSSYGCPVDNLIPEWNDLIYQGKWEDAYKRLRKTNNFPEFTGRVCPAPCQSACVLGINESPVSIKDNECAIADKAYEKGWILPQKPQTRNGKTVCIVGSGPAGLSAAEQLNELGYSVTVLEKDDRIGGLMMYGIPNMKLDKELLQKRCKIMQDSGVVFKTGICVGENADPEDLLKKFDVMLLTCGSTVPRDLPIVGRNTKNIYFAMDFLKANTKSLLDSKLQDNNYINAKGKHVIIIGGGDTGNDCIGTSIRHKAASITNFELLPLPQPQRSSEYPWPVFPRIFKSDYGHSEAQAVFKKDPREFSILTKKFLSKDGIHVSGLETVRVKWKKSTLGPPKMIETPNSKEVWKADLVLLALGFLGPEQALLNSMNIERNNRTNIKTEQFLTSRDKVFSAGDARRGQSLVVWAIHEGREAAKKIDESFRNKQNL